MPDYRVKGRCLHDLSEILFIALCTLLSNGEDFEDMVEFATRRKEWLSTKIKLPSGIPSHDTFNRVLQKVDPEHLKSGLKEDGARLISQLEGQLITIDGKKQKGVAPRSRGNSGLFILNAWVGEHNICIGQTKVMDKSNEITAIPILLDELELAGTTVSIDAIGCQKEIVEQIVAAGADYVLAVKGNQADLLEETTEAFEYTATQKAENMQWEYDHGRYETRRCEVLTARGCLSPNLQSKWASVRTLVKVTAQREQDGINTKHTRFYISSHQDKSAAELNQMIRSHWSIENQLHWHLDVTFAEDTSRARTGHAPLNLSILRKMALHRIKKDDAKLSQRKRRFRASMDTDYLDRLLKI